MNPYIVKGVAQKSSLDAASHKCVSDGVHTYKAENGNQIGWLGAAVRSYSWCIIFCSAALVMSVSILGCFEQTSDDNCKIQASLTGSWQFTDDLTIKTTILDEDGTFLVTSRVLAVFDPLLLAEGKWQVTDNKLITWSTTKAGIIVDESEIISVSPSELVLKVKTNSQIRTVRASKVARPNLKYIIGERSNVWEEIAVGNGLNMRLPLPGGKSWLLTTGVGNNVCDTSEADITIESHTQENHYSIDLSKRTAEHCGKMEEKEVPVLAAAEGWIVDVSEVEDSNNGYYVVIDHDNDKDPKTGFTTRYLHLAEKPKVKREQWILQGQRLGIMGSTGKVTGPHLHFGIRYNDDGGSTAEVRNQLQKVRIEGLPLDDYKVQCDGIKEVKYFSSSNIQPKL